MKSIVKIISDSNAPTRLIGQRIEITLERKKRKLQFKIETSDNLTPNEVGYLKLRIGEYVDDLRKDHPFIGENMEINNGT